MSTHARGHHPASRKKPGQLGIRPNARNRTGCHGVSLKTRCFRGGRVRRFFVACAGRRRLQFPVESLGLTEAFRRAVAARAAYERTLTTTHPPTP